MKITITITTSEPDYPLRKSISALREWIELALKTVSLADDGAGRYPATISDFDSPGGSAIEAEIEDSGVRQGRFDWSPAGGGDDQQGQGELW